MEIILDTSRCCIETASKKEYERIVRQYFKPCPSEKGKNILEEKIEALAYFLSHADFPGLRNQLGDSGAPSVLVVPRCLKNMYLSLNQGLVYPAWKTP